MLCGITLLDLLPPVGTKQRHVKNQPGHQGFDPRLPFPKGDCELGVALHGLDGGLRERWRTDTAVGRAEGFRGILNHRIFFVVIRNSELMIQFAKTSSSADGLHLSFLNYSLRHRYLHGIYIAIHKWIDVYSLALLTVMFTTPQDHFVVTAMPHRVHR